MISMRVNGPLAASLAFLFLLAIYIGWDKVVWAMEAFLRGLAAIKG